MSNKILFVDDDPILLSILSSMVNRSLGSEYDVQTVESGKAAIEIVDSHGPFSVVVVDMQMPEMDGIKTIGHLRQKMPQAVFVMLTGNQDQGTAIQAVNSGKVFQFLSKPCDENEIISTIQSAQAQYNTSVSSKDLLTNTFSGTLDLMTDLIEMPDGRHIDTTRIAEAISDLASRMSINLSWEERIAARVFLVGIAMLSPGEAERFESLDPTTDEHKQLFAKICKTSAGLLKKIPRFDWIVDLLRIVPTTDKFDNSGERIHVSALLLRVVFYWNFLTMKGLCVETTSATIRKIMPKLSDSLIDSMQCLNDNQDALCITSVSVTELRPGMIPHENIALEQGGIIVAGRRRLTTPMIENLMNNQEFTQRKVPIVSSSIRLPQDAVG